MITWKRKQEAPPAGPRYPGIPVAMDGSQAVVEMETAAGEAAGAYPITPSTQMGEGWALAVAAGTPNVNGRRLLFFEPEGEHAAAAVTAGMSMVGLRATNFSSGQGIAYMHESLYAAVGKRLTYVLNVAARAMTKHALNVHAGHDDYHCVDDTGFFQLFAKDVQESADLNLIAHRVAELSLNPGLVAQDGFLTSHVIESIRLPERELIREYLGDPADLIDAPTPAQRLVFGEKRRRIPEMFDYDYPAMLGVVQNQDSYAQGVAAQRPFYFDHVEELTELAMAEFAELTGRRYQRAVGYRLEDAEWVLAGQGSVVANAEAVADHLRSTRGLKVGVLNLTMFRPFPAAEVASLLRGKKGVTVLERTDQPLAVDPPLLREMRAAMSKAQENARARAHGEALPHRMPSLAHLEVPDFFSAGFGFGSRDLQPGDLVAAVENMLPSGKRRRQYYLGVDFIRKGTRLPKLQIWQEQLLDAYPKLGELSLEPVATPDLAPVDALALRIHSVGGWGAITTGKNVALTCFELLGLQVKANPKYGSEKKGQPTTFYATLSREPVRLNAELKHVDVVLSPDPNVFRHSDPLAGLSSGGAFVIQSELEPDALWRSLPAHARRSIIERGIRLYALDAFRIAGDEASDAELRYRMQGTAFMGAFFAVTPLAERHGLDRARLMEGIRAQLAKKFGKLGEHVVEDNFRVIRRGWDELRPVEAREVDEPEASRAALRGIPAVMDAADAEQGLADPGRFWDQTCALYGVGQDPIADPFAAISAVPAATAAMRDMTNIRFEVPHFRAELCTGCAQCWTQCPDSAIPGLVVPVEDLLLKGIESAGRPLDRVRQVQKHLAREIRRRVDAGPFAHFGDLMDESFAAVVEKLGWEGEKLAELTAEFLVLRGAVGEFPVARTGPFWDLPERKEKGSGGLLAITVNPEACKGCNICVEVCPEEALVTVRQDEAVVERLRENWRLWETLPDTPDRFINVTDLEEGIGVLPSLLLRKEVYRSMVGGDGACMGCGEKTTAHLVVAAVEALMQPRVATFVKRLDALVEQLDGRARTLLAADADLDAAAGTARGGRVVVALDEAKTEEVRRLNAALHDLKDLRWRYVEGPSGRGRANLGITNSTGCSSVWASTYPFNPYPFPWVNHLFQDAPSIAIGVFEGHMRKMADGFAAVRRAAMLAEGSYDAVRDEAELRALDWTRFTDEEFDLCPPLLVIGGDGAMLDIGFQNLSRLMASGKPIRVMVLDTQVYSNTGGQASTGTFTGQAADMSPFGKAQHGKTEIRKELSLIAIAHRGTYVLQSSQAAASHLMAGVLRGLQVRRPALFNLYTPCPVEHGLPDEWAPHAARLALESRAFPHLVFDPDAGTSLADCLSLDGNPARDEAWTTQVLEYLDAEGAEQRLTLPVTIADWASTEVRFRKHFRPLKDEEGAIPFHELMELPAEEREGMHPFIHAVDGQRRLTKLAVSPEIVRLADDRARLWAQLREMAGLQVSERLREEMLAAREAELTAEMDALRREYEAKLADLHASYPQQIARRLAQRILAAGTGKALVDLLGEIPDAGLPPVSAPAAPPEPAATIAEPAIVSAPAPAPAPAAATAPATATAPAAAPAAVATEDDDLAMEPYVETARCTSCNECTNLNGRLFAYNADKQAYIKDPRGGTFAQLVQAAERCPAAIIHPGTPLNPREKDLDKWVKRAAPFN